MKAHLRVKTFNMPARPRPFIIFNGEKINSKFNLNTSMSPQVSTSNFPFQLQKENWVHLNKKKQ